MKLAKKGGPVLTFEIRTPLGPILQDVPVGVLSAVRLQGCSEPDNESVLGFTLPPLARLHAAVENMRSISDELHIRADIGPEKAVLALDVRTDMVRVSSKYNELNRASFGAEGQTEVDADDDEQFQACVDRRNFSRCLHGYQLEPKHAICFMFQNSVMVHLMGGWDVTLTYYMPKRFAT